MTRRATLFAIVITIVAAMAAPADASAPEETGWWWRLGGSPVPPPAEVPDGGLWVSSDAAGTQSVSALRVDGQAEQLVLEVAESTGTGAAPELCVTDGGWVAVENGAFADRAVADCAAGRAPGQLAPDGSVWTFAVDGLGAAEVLDVVLQPSAPGTWSVTFAAPDDAAVVLPAQPPPANPVPPPVATTTTRPAYEENLDAFALPPPTIAPPALESNNAFGAPTGGIDAELFEQDVPLVVKPAPATGPAGEPAHAGRRIAALALLGVISVWILRTRSAVAGIDRHPLSALNFGEGDTPALGDTSAILDEAVRA